MFDMKSSGKAAMVAAVLGGFLLLGGAPQLHARDRDTQCEKRVHKARQNLEKQIRRHGEHSRQAEKARRRLEETRESCGGRPDHDRDRNRNHGPDHH